jgi:hypothetical protein
MPPSTALKLRGKHAHGQVASAVVWVISITGMERERTRTAIGSLPLLALYRKCEKNVSRHTTPQAISQGAESRLSSAGVEGQRLCLPLHGSIPECDRDCERYRICCDKKPHKTTQTSKERYPHRMSGRRAAISPV